MESNLVSFSVPNFITINLMAWAGILLFVFLYQAVMKRKAPADAANSGGY